MNFDEDEFLPLSALQHLVFCPRQCALIHIEQAWDENRLTAEGRNLHEKTHEAETESRPGIRIARSLRLHSFRLGLSGQADVVEFLLLPKGAGNGIILDEVSGRWMPFPVEYKRGQPKLSHCDIIQLCAQALCLEEMLNVKIEKGALFYGRLRRRQEVIFEDKLRKETENLAMELHKLIRERITPQARYEKKCDNCSLFSLCMPKITVTRKNIEHYLLQAKNQK